MRDRPRNRWEDAVRKDFQQSLGSVFGGEKQERGIEVKIRAQKWL